MFDHAERVKTAVQDIHYLLSSEKKAPKRRKVDLRADCGPTGSHYGAQPGVAQEHKGKKSSASPSRARRREKKKRGKGGGEKKR